MEHDNHHEQQVKSQKVCLGKCSMYMVWNMLTL
jgi:hypothetical protein